MKPIIPVLQHGLTSLSNPQDILLYLLRHFTYMPSGTTDSFYGMELSLTTVYAECGENKLVFETKVIAVLTEALERIFGSGSGVEVKARMGNLDSDDKYKLFIEMSVFIDKIMYSTANSITISNNSDRKMTLYINGEIAYL